MFNPEMKAIDDLANSRGGFKSRINVYHCQSAECGNDMVTIDRDNGVTPFMAICPKCGGMAQSRLYHVDQDQKPTHEWYRPDSLAEFPPQIQEHFRQGGLALRPLAIFAPMPDEVMPILEKGAGAIVDAMQGVIGDILALSIDGQDKAAMENHALSSMAELSAFSAIQFARQLAAFKEICPHKAIAIAVGDFNMRLQQAFEVWVAEVEADQARADGAIN